MSNKNRFLFYWSHFPILFFAVSSCLFIGELKAGDFLHRIYGNTCAVDALYLCLNSKGVNMDYSVLSHMCYSADSKTNLISLKIVVSILKRFNIPCAPVKTDLATLKQHKGVALLVTTTEEEMAEHIVFAKINKDSVTFYDPSKSSNPSHHTYDDLAKIWSGVAILIP